MIFRHHLPLSVTLHDTMYKYFRLFAFRVMYLTHSSSIFRQSDRFSDSSFSHDSTITLTLRDVTAPIFDTSNTLRFCSYGRNIQKDDILWLEIVRCFNYHHQKVQRVTFVTNSERTTTWFTQASSFP